MRYISVDEFKNRELKNGEEYILVCDIGVPLTIADLRRLESDLADSGDRFDVLDRWTDDAYRLYYKIRIKNNPIWGVAILLILSAVTVYVVGMSLAEVLREVGVTSEKATPLAAIGLAAIAIIVAVRLWGRKKRTSPSGSP